MQHTATHCNTLQHTAARCNTLQHTATHCNTLQQTATHCNTQQHGKLTHCNTLQRAATHCNTLFAMQRARTGNAKTNTIGDIGKMEGLFLCVCVCAHTCSCCGVCVCLLTLVCLCICTLTITCVYKCIYKCKYSMSIHRQTKCRVGPCGSVCGCVLQRCSVLQWHSTQHLVGPRPPLMFDSVCVYTHIHTLQHTHNNVSVSSLVYHLLPCIVSSISRLLEIIGLLCKSAL